MFPTSSRVKLNREAFEDVIGLKLVPRRRRVPAPLKNVESDSPKQEEPLQTPLSDPENVDSVITGEPRESRVGTPKAKRRKGDNSELKRKGPRTGGKYPQSPPNTRSEIRGDRLGTRGCNWCLCAASVRVLLRRAEVKPRAEKLPSVAYTGISKLSASRMKTRSKVRVTRGATRDMGRGGSRPAASRARPAGTRSKPPGLSNNNIHLSPTGPAGSKGSLRRALRPSGCGLCGDCKYISPQRKTWGKQGQNSSNPGSKQPTFEFKIKEENRGTEATKNIMLWTDKYPKVSLCDVAQKCDAFCQDFGYMLPDDLKTKVVHCFKQEMRARFLVDTGCSGHSKHERDEAALAKNIEFCPRLQPESSVCQSQSLPETQIHLKERTDAQTLPSNGTYCFLKSWTGEGTATSSASLLPGKHTKEGEYRTDMTDVREDPGPGSRLLGADICTDKRRKLGDAVNEDLLPTTPALERINCKSPANTDTTGDGDKTCCWMSDDSQSCSEHAVDGRSVGSAVKENGIRRNTWGEIDSPANTDTASSELSCQENEMDIDQVETFTCQRVRAYFGKNNFSCARTSMCWPFSNRGVTFTAHAGSAACPTESIDPSGSGDSPITHLTGVVSNLTNGMLPSALTDPPSNLNYVSPQNCEKPEMDAQSILETRNGENKEHMSPDNTNEFLSHLMENDSLEGPQLSMTIKSCLGQCGGKPGTGTISASSFPVNITQAKVSTPTPFSSNVGSSDWETGATLTSLSSPCTHDDLSSISTTPSSLPPSSFLLRTSEGVELADASSPSCMVKAVEKTSYYEETQTTSCSSSSSASLHDSDPMQSCDSSLLLPQDQHETDEDFSPCSHFLKGNTLHNTHTEKCVEFPFMLPSVLSPLSSPRQCSPTSVPAQSPGCSDGEEEEDEMKEGTFKHRMSPGCHMPQTIDTYNENTNNYFAFEGLGEVPVNSKPPLSSKEPRKSLSNDKGVDEEECQSETDCEDDIEQGREKSEQVPPDPEIQATRTSDFLTESCSSPSTVEDGEAFTDESRSCSARAEGSRPSDITGSERDQTAGDSQRGILDEFSAYEQDILLVDVNQDDPELFENQTRGSLLKLGPTRVTEAPKPRPSGSLKTQFPRIDGPSPVTGPRSTPVNFDFLCGIPDVTEESEDRPWRPQCSRSFSKAQNGTWPAPETQTNNMNPSDANNNCVNENLERNQPIKTISSLANHIRPLTTMKNGPWITSQVNVTEFRRQKSNSYCRLYFSETLSCGFKMCRFQHVPVEGDEKFCIDTVMRFTKNPMCLQKAGAVFTGYYHNNPPGVYFSMPVLLSLLWSLLKTGLLPDVFSVLRVSSAHKLVPDHEFLLALFNYVREKGLMGLVPELMQLTFKMANAGLVLSLDCLGCIKNTPEFQQNVDPHSVSGKISTSAPLPECLNLAHAVVEIELCSKQRDWRRMAEVFTSICQTTQRPNLVEQISGRIAIALLSESKDKLSLPFATFAETVCQNGEDDLLISFLGRIGVSLMLRYHKTHQWSKGRRVVEMLFVSKVTFSTLKGLFGNEDRASRCYLITVATELFLLSGSVEGALNTLRENEWFLSSCLWPCEPADLESRIRVLMRLVEKTSHRDTLEVLRNLPGLKEPTDLVNISKYCPLFNAHLQVCVDRQMLPVASDTVDFMFSKNLAVEHTMLGMLLHKLGKQNLWLRAREVFRHSLSVGYYPGVSAPPGFMTLIVPCRLGEVELALTFEMFVTVNASVILHLSETTTCCLSITLKRAQSCESEYLSAGSRLLSAAGIPHPKLIVHYKAVNSLQDQVFNLDVPSARCWLRHNHLWANEVWTH